jgi:hypothetical protein
LKQQEGAKDEMPVSLKTDASSQKNEIINKKEEKQTATVIVQEPVVPKTAKSFSIKDLIADDEIKSKAVTVKGESPVKAIHNGPKEEFSEEAFGSAWLEFLEFMKGEGTRIVSMFKSVVPEVESNRLIRLHLSNADQKETFVQNYKHKLIAFLESRFLVQDIDIESIVDEVQTNDILYTDEQKYNYLFGKYPVLKEMKRVFNLDLN